MTELKTWLTDKIEVHKLRAGDCPPNSLVVLASALARLLEASPAPNAAPSASAQRAEPVAWIRMRTLDAENDYAEFTVNQPPANETRWTALYAAPAPSASPETMVYYGGGETPISMEDDAPSASPGALTDEQIYALAANAMGNPMLVKDLRAGFPIHTESGDWLKFARALLAASPAAQTVAWATVLPSGAIHAMRTKKADADRRTDAWNADHPRPPLAITAPLALAAPQPAAANQAGLAPVPNAFLDKFKAAARSTHPHEVMALVDEANDLLAASPGGDGGAKGNGEA